MGVNIVEDTFHLSTDKNPYLIQDLEYGFLSVEKKNMRWI